jgi:hypothetical protein
MGAHKKVAAGAAALSVVALATLMGAPPASAQICTTECPGGDHFQKFTFPGGSVDVFNKVAPQTAFQKVELNLFPGVTKDVFLKYGSD